MASETIEQALRRLRTRFIAAAIGEDAAVDARRLLASALKATSADLIRDPARILTPSESDILDAYAARRVAREPVSRILGEREFYGRPFAVTPAVLDPRADTETLIDAALSIAGEFGWDQHPITILDIGTGSGAIICTLLAQLPLATGLAIDISADALAVARTNAASIGLCARLTFERRDIFAGLPPGPATGFDLVVSNPPYIVSTEIAQLDPEVAAYDPILALDGGSDGLKFYRAILECWASDPQFSLKQRALIMELGAGQSPAVVEIAARTGNLKTATSLQTHRDLNGHERCVAVRTQLKS